MKTHLLRRSLGILAGMLLPAREALASPLFPLAQVPTDVRTGFATVLGLLCILSFVRGVMLIWDGVDRMRKSGDASEGKMSLFGGALLAGAPIIMGALFFIFGLADAVLEPVF
ncbi:MAG: hypothetical protein ACOZE5_09000 [Verrucomicrobiota bacterium]